MIPVPGEWPSLGLCAGPGTVQPVPTTYDHSQPTVRLCWWCLLCLPGQDLCVECTLTADLAHLAKYCLKPAARSRQWQAPSTCSTRVQTVNWTYTWMWALEAWSKPYLPQHHFGSQYLTLCYKQCLSWTAAKFRSLNSVISRLAGTTWDASVAGSSSHQQWPSTIQWWKMAAQCGPDPVTHILLTQNCTQLHVQFVGLSSGTVPAGRLGTMVFSVQLRSSYARYCDRLSVRLSVCLSVRPSVKRVYCDKTKAPSEKSSIMTNRKSPTGFPMSLRWTSYVAANPQRGPQKRKFDQ